jgi:hypothetical protein
VTRLKDRRWGHVLFQGSVPGAKRKDLIDRFREDPDCRVFLSTDAGGTGLNLQHASAVINMDLPWNPAVLEQRIGRVHRIGQKSAVRVVNFIAQGTIEEGMLSVLRFKKSLFAGVLDGGEKDVFLGGSRLNKFLETVEKVTSSIPEATVEEADAAAGAPREPAPLPDDRVNGHARRRPATPPETPTAPPAPPAADPWTGLLQAGMALLQQFAAASGASASSAGGTASRPPASPLLARDERTGEPYLRLPVPPPEVVEQVLKTVGSLLEGLRK